MSARTIQAGLWPLAVALLLVASAAIDVRAQESPVPLGPNGRAQYHERFLVAGFHRAFASAPDGRFAWVAHRPSIEAAIDGALKACNRDGQGCVVRVVNGIPVDNGDPATIPLRDPQAPPLGPLVPGDYVRIRGADRAPGLVIWSHGYRPGRDSTRVLAHPYVNRFAAAGWDVYRYNRQTIERASSDLAGLMAGIKAARDAGYRRIVLAGQSRGAWISLQAAADGAPIDAVIATAPATHGNRPDSAAFARARPEFQALLRRVAERPESRRIVISFFDGDDFEPGGRREDVATVLGPREAVLFIDHPEAIRGHGGGGSPGFNARFGACIFVFIDQAQRHPSCP